MKYTIYKITNKINSKVYIGKHKTTNPYDNYYGSGKIIKHAIKIYGKDTFTKEVLFIFDTEKEMNDKESELVNESFISTDKTYNIGIGGEGGPHFLGKKHTEETKRKLSEKMKGNKISDEGRKRISESSKNRKFTEVARKKMSEKAKGRRLSVDHKNAISKTLIGKLKGTNNPQFGTMWITNGTENKKIKKEEQIPAGWKVGRVMGKYK